MTDNLLLRIRLESLRNSFQQVGALREAMTLSNAGVERLWRLLSGEDSDSEPDSEPAGVPLRSLLASVDGVLASLLSLLVENRSLRPLDFELQRLTADDVRNARDRLAELQKNIASAQDEADALREDMNDWIDLGIRGQEHATSDASDFRQASQRVDGLLTSLEHGGDIGQTWESYRTLVATRTPPLFKSYVDIASGLTLRGLRLDGRVCAMADDLVVDWARYHDLSRKALTIPAFDDEEQPSHMVRFGFAAWTVWSLPLFAGTFWRMYADLFNSIALTSLATDEPSRRRVRTYLGDCLAVEMMGPAYACALILLRLDPAQTEDEAANLGFDSVRAQVVMDMMRPAATRERSKLQEIFDLLDDAWTDAQVLAGDADQRSTDFDYAAPVVALAREVVSEFGPRIGALAGVGEDRWEASRALAGSALSPPTPDDGDKVDREKLSALLRNSSVVDVLNAAWRRRLLPATCLPPAPELPGRQADEARRIAARVSSRVWPSLPRPTSGASPMLSLRGATRRG
jgi:hypothetical protein